VNSKLPRLNGIVTVVNTPFTADNAIDLDSLSANVAYALDAGVAGFLVPALASEVGKLTQMERETLVRRVVDDVDRRVPVIGGASAEDQSTREHLTAALLEMGCDGVLVNIPYQSDAQYATDVHGIARQKPGFLMLQDWDFSGYGLPVALIARLFEEIDVFQSLKIEVVPAGVKYTEVLEATGGKLHLAGGWAVTQMIEALDRGVHTMMPTAMHRVYVQIFNFYQAGQRDAAVGLFNQIAPVLAFSNQHLDISIHFFKRLLCRQGIYSTPRVREPILTFDRYHARIADELIDRAIELEHQLAAKGP
jgi:dihydrodipicolinate synthase/N-acetylneuraminate lyase